MGTIIAGILGVGAVSHFGGMALGGLLARAGIGGFGPKLSIGRALYRVGKALHQRAQEERSKRAQDDLRAWLAEHDPRNQTGFGDDLRAEE